MNCGICSGAAYDVCPFHGSPEHCTSVSVRVFGRSADLTVLQRESLGAAADMLEDCERGHFEDRKPVGELGPELRMFAVRKIAGVIASVKW